jgi:hypothetical protein
MSTSQDRHERHLLHIKEDLADVDSNWSKGGKYDGTDECERGNARGFLLWTQDRELVLDVIPDPKGTMNDSTKEHSTTGPAVDVVELLIAISWSQKERQQ